MCQFGVATQLCNLTVNMNWFGGAKHGNRKMGVFQIICMCELDNSQNEGWLGNITQNLVGDPTVLAWDGSNDNVHAN